MCFKTPKAPPVEKAPTRDATVGATADAARKLKEQSGVENNIFTSALGDTQYGAGVKKLAKLGAAA